MSTLAKDFFHSQTQQIDNRKREIDSMKWYRDERREGGREKKEKKRVEKEPLWRHNLVADFFFFTTVPCNTTDDVIVKALHLIPQLSRHSE